MISVGQSYRAGGRIDAQALLSATILGTVTAVVTAAIVWAWELSPIPTLVILTPLVHGFLIGFVLAALIGRLKLRHPKLMWTVGAACGLASVGLIHYAHYLHTLDQFRQAIHAQIEADGDATPEQKAKALTQDTNPIANAFLQQKFGHGGFLGSMMLRAEQGYQIKKIQISGVGTWILWGCETLAVVLVAATLARTRAAQPFCEDCEVWCDKALSPVQLAGESSHALAEAVRTDNTHQAHALLGLPINAELLQTAGTRAALHSCGACDQTFADVETYVVQIKKGKAETVTSPVLKLMRISPAMTALLREPQGPAGPAEEGEGEGEGEAEAEDRTTATATLDPHRHEMHPDGTPLEQRDL